MAVKKKAASKKLSKKKITKVIPSKIANKKAGAKALLPAPKAPRKHRIYIESCAFFPGNSSDGYKDLFQSGRHAVVTNKPLFTPIVLPVGAILKSISIHYTNSTTTTPIAFFLRKHADRHSPSGEIEMSFINIPPGVLPPDNYLTVTDTSFPDAGLIKDKFLHYLEVSGTGDYGAGGKITVRGVSLVYTY